MPLPLVRQEKYPLRLPIQLIEKEKQRGAHPPGDFRNFTFCVDHIEEIVNNPLTKKEKKLFEHELLAVKEYPYVNPQA